MKKSGVEEKVLRKIKNKMAQRQRAKMEDQPANSGIVHARMDGCTRSMTFSLRVGDVVDSKR